MTSRDSSRPILADAREAVRAADPAALLVPPRILRRVIRQDRELPGIGFLVPHRKSYIISRERLGQFVEPDELGLESAAMIPPQAILVSQPTDSELAGMVRDELLRSTWRLLFHARIHATLDDRVRAGELTPADVRARIDRIGQVAFDEIRAVLRRENFLIGRPDLLEVYVEFAAVFLEYRHFAPNRLPTYFPSLAALERVDAVLAEDVDSVALLRQTRLKGAPEAARIAEGNGHGPDLLAPPLGLAQADRDDAAESGVEIRAPRPAQVPGRQGRPAQPNRKRFDRLTRRAENAAGHGNDVRAAIVHQRASHYAKPEHGSAAVREASAAVDRLVARLRDALAFDEAAARAWRDVLGELLIQAARGFWNADRRLLYDLQKVCADHERVVYRVDLFEWMRTLGRRPIKRALPNQREVLMSKHLRTAAGRLAAVRLSGRERDRLAGLLHDAARSAERQLRDRLRPLITEALEDVGLAPRNIPERVARKKLAEELLDAIVHRGFLTMAALRDALSRSNLKLPDLSGIAEFVKGDKLLRADRRLALLLDGVYRRGEFYLRWLQRLSSVAFGTPVGRFLTLYVFLPFGGAFVILEGVRHILELAMGEDAPRIVSLVSVLTSGGFLLGLMHARSFRRLVWSAIRSLLVLLRKVLIDAPAWVLRQPHVRRFLRSRPVVLFRRAVLTPGVLASLFWFALPALGIYDRPSPAGGVALFLGFAAVLNTRIGRDVEELATDWADYLWHQFRARIFIALFELVMETFKRLLEAFERLMYAVDEWLRFKSGETSGTLASKAVLGVGWAAAAYLARFCITLLIEPQVNPIKHFPVVTVSHKILLPTQPILSRTLKQALEPVASELIATGVVTLLPGVFGFLVWELKSNWRLYEANRPKRLQPVIVGDHGETLVRLLKPGFHSGTVPKLYGKLRRAERQDHPARRRRARAKLEARLHHVEVDVRQFVERELVTLLDESRAWRGRPLTVGDVAIASNNMAVELRSGPSESGLLLSFQEQSGRIVAGVLEPGWLSELDVAERNALAAALAGLYKLAGVELIHEQIAACFGPAAPPYDIAEQGLVVWPGGEYQVEVRYDLRERPLIVPSPEAHARPWNLPDLEPQRLIFAESPIGWQRWCRAWEGNGTDPQQTVLTAETVRLLPETPVTDESHRRAVETTREARTP